MREKVNSVPEDKEKAKAVLVLRRALQQIAKTNLYVLLTLCCGCCTHDVHAQSSNCILTHRKSYSTCEDQYQHVQSKSTKARSSRCKYFVNLCIFSCCYNIVVVLLCLFWFNLAHFDLNNAQCQHKVIVIFTWWILHILYVLIAIGNRWKELFQLDNVRFSIKCICTSIPKKKHISA